MQDGELSLSPAQIRRPLVVDETHTAPPLATKLTEEVIPAVAGQKVALKAESPGPKLTQHS